jgi:coupling of ubiquitin conjugation to ER degradation protein 1
MSDTTQATLNIPQLAVLLVIGFLAIRWVLSPRADESQPPGASARGASRAANPRHVETKSQMFPQLDRRAIMWDLQRNGNNLQMTTERFITGGGLDTVSLRAAQRFCMTAKLMS